MELNSGQSRRAGSPLLFTLLFTVVAAFDQWTKAEILRVMEPGEIFPVIEGFFNLTLAFNRGVAFGLFADFADGVRHLMLAATACAALGAVVFFFMRDYAHDVVGRAALVVILAGACGNIIDRLRLGMVVDFLDFYVGANHWPAFNVADSAICLGVAVLLLRRPAAGPE